jgi:transposase-like protein
VPEEACRYLAHVEDGVSIRSLARRAGCHASTVLRQVRKFEARRDDLLIDHALRRLVGGQGGPRKEPSSMTTPQSARTAAAAEAAPDVPTVEREARRILRRLNEPGACLAVAPDMEKAVVVRETGDGQTVRTGIVDRAVAEALALKDWIAGTQGAPQTRLRRYRITATGRIALKRLIAEEDHARGLAEAGAAFGHQHRDFATREVGEPGRSERRRVRYNAAESPLVTLSRRREKDGAPFLSDDLVAAGERLREDFELAQMGPRTTQNWDRFLTGGVSSSLAAGGGMAEGPKAARDRVIAALGDLGPGLGDVVLRCCCFLEGMEAAERRMGWSARSGKIVLRIALQRLKRHYDTKGGWSPLIG